MDFFKNACRIHTDFMVGRYLMSNADGRQNGAEKAHYHMELCKFYVAVTRGHDDPRTVREEYEEDFEVVHERTQELTSFLDERIGFPLTGRPDYDTLKPLFFDLFHELAMAALTHT
ncbi:MAG: hypothetical protein FD134_1222 [Gallionellaceae bacterium]|nr:MAG: hypothetical protein FD134_1222 [Gallionellaceae bacterium]